MACFDVSLFCTISTFNSVISTLIAALSVPLTASVPCEQVPNMVRFHVSTCQFSKGMDKAWKRTAGALRGQVPRLLSNTL